MTFLTTFPEWEIIAEHLRIKLGYSDATIIRTSYTYNVFVSDYCIFEGGDADSILQDGIRRANGAYETGAISKDKLLRIRRLAFRMVEFVQTGTISWKRAAESIIKRDENLIRQYILFAEGNGRDIKDMDIQGILVFHPLINSTF